MLFILDATTHAEQVSGVLAAKENLAQLKGVAPGARILQISKINEDTLAQIKRSSARVINISKVFQFPANCAGYFKTWQAQPNWQAKYFHSANNYCKVLWNFITLVNHKDMIVVQAASNEGIQTE